MPPDAPAGDAEGKGQGRENTATNQTEQEAMNDPIKLSLLLPNAPAGDAGGRAQGREKTPTGQTVLEAINDPRKLSSHVIWRWYLCVPDNRPPVDLSKKN